jgi:hypothetical protein
MKKLRDRARTPLIVALPAILSLVLIASMPTWTFGREAPPILREETDGGGDEWNDMCPTTLLHSRRLGEQEVPLVVSGRGCKFGPLVYSRVVLVHNWFDLALVGLVVRDLHVRRATEVTVPYNRR